MAYALVGTAGAAATPAASVTPIWDASESRASPHLLVCWAVDTNNIAVPTTTTAGWSTAVSQVGTSSGGTALFYSIATGGDVAPTVSFGGGTGTAAVAEFSGNATSLPLDQAVGATAAASPVTATAPGADAATGELLLYVSCSSKSGAGNTNTLTNTLTNAATKTEVLNNGATSLNAHYAWGFGVTTAHAVADADAFSIATTTNINGMTAAIASFKLPPATLLIGQRGRHPQVHNRTRPRGRF